MRHQTGFGGPEDAGRPSAARAIAVGRARARPRHRPARGVTRVAMPALISRPVPAGEMGRDPTGEVP
jgi:hypothetical protein